MNRQQRTPYLRQRQPTAQNETLLSMLWWIESISGPYLQCRLVGPRDNVVINGVPQILPLQSGCTPIGVTIADGPQPDQYNQMIIEFDAPLLPYDVFTLEQPSQAVRNKWGGLLSASVQTYPAPGLTSMDITASLSFWTPTEVGLLFTSQFGQVCIGPAYQIYNSTTFEDSTFGVWANPDVVFTFPSVSVGDQIVWPASNDLIKANWGGTLVAGSSILA